MNAAASGPEEGLTTEQIAGAGASPVQDRGGEGNGSVLAAGDEPRASLLEESELQRIVTRWQEIQGDFVDAPEHAVKQADALVADLMQRLAAMFASERAALEGRWAGGGDGASTEELRQSLRLYRSFFERLLAA